MPRDFNRDWALRLAEAGMAVFPCGPDKKPLIKWRALSSSDPQAVAQMWSAHPGALPAIDLAKCNLFVLDGDRHGGPDGRSALRSLLQEQGFKSSTAPTALTPGDGVHVYFGQNGHELTNARGSLPPGVDARGWGGYVVAPYAVLADGRRYMSVPGAPDLIAAFKAGSIPHVPQGVVNLIQARKQKDSKADSGPATGSIRESSYALAALEGCAAELAAAAPGQRNETLNALAYRLGRMAARGWIERAEVEAALTGAATANGYISDDGADAAAATLRSGIDAGMNSPHEDLRDQEEPNPADKDQPQPDAPSLLVRIDLARYDSEPVPAREWGVPDRFPRRAVCLLSGEGGRGKSITLLQLAAAHVLAKDWLRSMPEPGPVVLVNAEDEEGEIIRRLKPIVEHYGASFADVARDLHIFSLAGADPLLAVPDRRGRIVGTALYAELMALVRAVQPICTIIDNVADVFGANEIERSAVRQFIALMRQCAIAGNGYVIMSSHPSLTGLASKTGLSGSTQWHNSVRARAWMHGGEANNGEASDPDLRVLEFLKSNYSRLAETITLRWQNGLYVPVSRQGFLDEAAANAAANEMFLGLLDRFTRAGENVSNKPSSNNYAPSRFAAEDEAKTKHLNKAALAAAMRRLFTAEQIAVEPYGPPSRDYRRIIRKAS